MAKPRPHDPAPKAPVPDPRWSRLNWDDLDDWAGGRSVSRGRSYQGQSRVKDLAITGNNRLLATVAGGERYSVSVWLQDEPSSGGASPRSICTCPVGADGCKHAVAVVVEYLDRLSRGERVAHADADDPRWAELEDASAGLEEDEEFDTGAAPAGRKSKWRASPDRDEKIRQHIHGKGREELAELVCRLAERFPELREELQERIALGEGDADRLVAQARKEIHRVTSQEAWRNDWTGAGNTPDYGKLLHRFERLAELGHADAVVDLGRELLARGLEQVGMAHDEGETAAELSRCLPVVFRAVAGSSLTPQQRLLFAIDAILRDDYDIIGDAADNVMNADYRPAVWSAVADDLSRRLSATATKRRASGNDDANDDFSRDYLCEQISSWLAQALERAGRGDEVPAVYEMEAKTRGSYERLVRFLIEHGRDDDARRWAAEGIAATISKWPGIASNLAKQLQDLAARHKQWEVVAAHAAHLFFETPSRDRFNELMIAAGKAGGQEPVRKLALRYLETGVSPIRLATSKKGERRIVTDGDWPLPMPEYLAPLWREDGQRRAPATPHYDVLIDMTIADKRPDDVLHWYDRWRARTKASPHRVSWFHMDVSDRVAEAVGSSHPHRALEIYRSRVDHHLAYASVSEYEAVASYLRKMRPILKSMSRDEEWTQLVQLIRERYRNRPRFMEVLDRLEDRPIVSRRKRRG